MAKTEAEPIKYVILANEGMTRATDETGAQYPLYDNKSDAEYVLKSLNDESLTIGETR